ncbi:hypothetical protein L6R52_44035, partial [Myxococcota bacterium]|nr:hypothetical protein [Myxococcota bacterium]
MTRVEGGRSARAAEAEAPKSNAPQLAEKVFAAAAASPDPAAVLALGSAEGPQKGYRVLAMRLHPDRAVGVDDDAKARLEDAFKL